MPAYSHPYDGHNYDPAMPVLEVTLAAPASGEPRMNVLALVDSGSDATLLPGNALEESGALYLRSRRIRGITGHAILADVYLTSLRVGPYTIRGIRAVAVSSEGEAILGRDVLNQLDLRLIGPAQELWLE